MFQFYLVRNKETQLKFLNLFDRIFMFDEFHLIICHQSVESFTKSVNELGIAIKDKEATVLPFDISGKGNIRSFLKNNKIKLLYITPIRGIDISEITKICKEEGVLTITGVEEYSINQVSVVLSLEDNKLQIMINQKSSKQEGADFSSRLLRIAKLIE